MKKFTLLCSVTLLTLALGACGQKDSKTSSGGSDTTQEHVHNYVEHAAVAKTCTEDGNIFYYSCEGCGKYFDEHKDEIALSQTIIPASHELVKYEEVVGFEVTESEHYQCSVCHKYFADEEGALEIEEGEWNVPGTAVYFAKGEAMTTRVINKVKLADLKGKALAFDFRMVEDGTNTLCMGQTNDTYNVSGEFKITKSGDTYTSPSVLIKDCETREGYKTLVMNETLFYGDGVTLHGADGIDRIFGGWDHENQRSTLAEAGMYIDGESFRVVNAYNHKDLGPVYIEGCDVDKALGYTLTKEELTNKALSFDVYFGAEGDQTIKFSLYNNGWAERFIPDIFVKRIGTDYVLTQLSPESTPLKAQIVEKEEDGWVNVVVNAKSLQIESEQSNTCVVWADPTTNKNGVDINSFEAVDPLDIPNEIEFNNGDFKAFGANIAVADLITNGAVKFKAKVAAGTTAKLSFMNEGWANFGTLYFTADQEGKITVKDFQNTVVFGEVTLLENGWNEIVLNEYEFSGDGRSHAGTSAITRIFAEGSFTLDGDSFEYCARHTETGMSYAGSTTVQRASWDGGHNFAYPKAKLALKDAGLAFDFKPVGDGTISLALMGDDWANISGVFSITKSGDTVTSSYPGAKIVARADGWYSIYVPAPWTGDGYDRDSWSSFALIYAGGGYSGTSIDINWDSVHMFNTAFLPA